MFPRFTIIRLSLLTRKNIKRLIPFAERAVQVSKRDRGPEHPETAETPNNLGLSFPKDRGDYAKADREIDERYLLRDVSDQGPVPGANLPCPASSRRSMSTAQPLSAQPLRKLASRSLFKNNHPIRLPLRVLSWRREYLGSGCGKRRTSNQCIGAVGRIEPASIYLKSCREGAHVDGNRISGR